MLHHLGRQTPHRYSASLLLSASLLFAPLLFDEQPFSCSARWPWDLKASIFREKRGGERGEGGVGEEEETVRSSAPRLLYLLEKACVRTSVLFPKVVGFGGKLNNERLLPGHRVRSPFSLRSSS